MTHSRVDTKYEIAMCESRCQEAGREHRGVAGGLSIVASMLKKADYDHAMELQCLEW